MSLQIRPATYRRWPGFVLSGRSPDGHNVRIFTRTRSAAERMREQLRAGEEITLGDFERDTQEADSSEADSQEADTSGA